MELHQRLCVIPLVRGKRTINARPLRLRQHSVLNAHHPERATWQIGPDTTLQLHPLVAITNRDEHVEAARGGAVADIETRPPAPVELGIAVKPLGLVQRFLDDPLLDIPFQVERLRQPPHMRRSHSGQQINVVCISLSIATCNHRVRLGHVVAIQGKALARRQAPDMGQPARLGRERAIPGQRNRIPLAEQCVEHRA